MGERVEDEMDQRICALCHEPYEYDEEYVERLGLQADHYGMASLTEDEQAILEGTNICEGCRC